MNKKGSVFTDLFILIAVVVVAVLFFAGWIYAHDLLTTEVISIDQPPNSLANVSEAGQDVFGQSNVGLQGLRWVALAMVIGMIGAIFISNFLVKAHPLFLVVYFLIVLVAIFLSVPVSNAYENILENNTLPVLSEWTGINYIFLNLPIWITVIGIIGGILLFVGATSDNDTGGGLM